MARNVRQKLEPALGNRAKRLQSERQAAPRQAPQVELQESVAELLRRTREQYGEDLKAVAESLRIRHVHLKSIEDGRFRDLPGPAYAMGFVRSYADYLGLDGPDVVERFKDEVEGLNRKTQLVFPTPVPEGKVPGGALILISLLLMGIAYGGWIYLSNQGKTIADLIPPVPEHLQALVGGADPEEAEAQATGSADAPAEEFQVAEPGGVATDTSAVQPAETAQPDASTAPSDGEDLAAPRSAAVMPVEEVPAGGEPAAAPVPSTPAAESAVAGEAGVIPPSDEFDSVEEAPAAENQIPQAEGTLELAGAAETDAGASQAEGSEPVAPAQAAEADGASESAAAAPEPLGDDGSVTLANVIDAQARASAEAEQAAQGTETATGDVIPAAPQLAVRAQGREPQVYGADNEDARIVLRAKLDSWVQIRDGEDGLVMTRVLREGDSYRVPNQEGLTLLTGNAGGIEISVDGAPLAPIGPVGSVRRDVALDPELLVQGRAVSQ